MKLLITGGAGFIGSNFIRYWFGQHPEDSIINLDKLTYAGNLENLKGIDSNPNYTFIKGDVADPVVVREAMKGVDMVVHFAAESHVDRSLQDGRPFIASNIAGTYELLEAARDLKVSRFHLISTDEVFGDLPNDGSKFNEQTPYWPSSPYSASKAAADMLARAFQRSFGVPVTISNCGNNYGPYHFPEKLIPLMILNALADKPLPVYGDGLQIRDWIYVEDHARAIEAILLKGKVGETYVVAGSKRDITNLEVVKTILKELGKPETLIEYVKDRAGHDRRYSIDASKIKNELGFEPKYTFEEGLKQTIEWYKENQEWCEHVLNNDYQAYYQKQYGER